MGLRRRLQAEGAESAERLLKKRSRAEARHTATIDHTVSKRIVSKRIVSKHTVSKRIVSKGIVTTAWGHLPGEGRGSTGRAVALADLTGIRGRVRHRKDQRTRLRAGGFHQLGRYVADKEKRAGVPLVYVDGVRRPGVHRPTVLAVPSHRPELPCRSGDIGVPVLRDRPARGPQRVPHHRPHGRDRVGGGV